MGRIRHLTTLVAVLLYSTLTLHAQDTNFVRQHMRVLTSNEMWGRAGSHEGEAKAAHYLADQFRQVGAIPLGENGLQYYDVGAHKMEGKVEISINGKVLKTFDDYRIAAYSHTTHAKNAPIIRIDASLLLDETKLTAFIDKNSAALKKAFVYIDAEQWKKKDDENAKLVQKALQDLMFNNPFQSIGILLGKNDMPTWGLNYTDVERNYAYIYVLRSQFTKKVKAISVDFDNTFYIKHSQNVCFFIRGKQCPDSMIVFTAHYDHLGCMGDDMILPGAHDNASGSCAVLDFARHYSQNPPKYTTVFLLFSGEEAGLQGSHNFVENALIDLQKVKLLLNIDMFCGGNDGFTVVNYNSKGTQPFYDNLVEINEVQKLATKVNPRVNTANSDHYYFSKKCPAIFIYTMGGRTGHYHHYSDTCDSCGLDCYNNIFSLIRQAVDKL